MRRIASLAVVLAVTIGLSGCITPPPLPQVQPGQTQGPDASGQPVAPVWPANMASHGAIFTAAGVQQTPPATEQRAAVQVEGRHAILYIDYMCPYCGEFMRTHGDELEAAVAAGDIALEVRPLAFLDEESTDEYSTRTAGAFAAVVDEFPESAWAFHRALFAAQPEQDTAGLSNDALIEIAGAAGAASAQLSERILTVAMRDFTTGATQTGLDEPVVPGGEPPAGTPALFIDGVHYEGSLDEPGAVADFIAEQT